MKQIGKSLERGDFCTLICSLDNTHIEILLKDFDESRITIRKLNETVEQFEEVQRALLAYIKHLENRD